MSAYPSHDGSTAAGLSPFVASGESAPSIEHAIDLALIFSNGWGDRSEALVAETRRHIAGCAHAIETALRLSLGSDIVLSSALARLPDPLCWPTICAKPNLLEPALLRHMRLRAGVGLILRQSGRANDGSDHVAGPLLEADDPALIDMLSLLAMAEGRWATPGSEHQPMRPDLPAEYFADLLWTVVAILARALEPQLLPGATSPLPALTAAGHGLLARHDETLGPLAIADRLASRLGEAAKDPGLASRAIGQRRLPLFAALAGRRLRMDGASVIALLLTEPAAHVAALCAAMGASGVEYRHLLLALQPARPTLTDACIIAASEGYAELDAAGMEGAMNVLSAPAPLRAKLDQLKRASAA
jgi:hypothetical protein